MSNSHIHGGLQDFNFVPDTYIPVSPTDKALHTMANNQERMVEVSAWLVKQIGEIHEHISAIYTMIHELAPDLEVIDTMYSEDQSDEREAAINSYMNHGEW